MVIKVLDANVANQIAAGEVVDRPASVIKELVENSIDAGASAIYVDVEHGGSKLIRVRDDGDGILPEDLPLAILPHATSKIESYDDLYCIGSLGFRGEALASISSVSRLSITSKHFSADQAWRLKITPGSGEPSQVPAAHTQGTTISASELFYNTPARKKFLRADATEFRHIETALSRLALSHLGVGFYLTHNDKPIFQLPAAKSMEEKERRLSKILGARFLAHALCVDAEASGMKLSGWVALPEYNRSQMDQQYFYLNGRFIRDKMLMRAVRDAFKDVMFHGRHAAYVIYLEVDPKVVDVNVHPTKSEVRFRDGRSEFQFVVQAIKSVLLQTSLGAGHREETPSMTSTSSSLSVPSKDVTYSPAPAPQQKAMTFSQQYSESVHTLNTPSACAPVKDLSLEQAPVAAYDAKPHVNVSEHMKLGVALAALHDIYILAQTEQGLIVVDMHAGHERVLYERMKRDYANKKLQAQALLIPLAVSVSPDEMQCFLEHQHELLACGLSVDVVGPDDLMIREIPVLLKDAPLDTLLRDILSDLIVNAASSRLLDMVDLMFSTMACKSAIKAHHKLSIDEMNALLRSMEQTPHGGLCNHGRPAWKQIPMREIDQWFLRGQ
jgi:DNA mismatch repair protein MutL